MITASDFRPLVKNTLRGFLALTLAPSGLVLCDCMVHEKNGQRWISLPSKPQLDSDGHHRTDPATGKRLYSPIIEFTDKAARDRFMQAALVAVDTLLEDA